MENELDAITFFRDRVMISPTEQMLGTLDDSDVNKLESLNNLILTMRRFAKTLESLGIKLFYTNKGAPFFNLVIPYHGSDLTVFARSYWLDQYSPLAICAGFSFNLYVGQQIRPEIVDDIKIIVKYLETTPFSLASSRQHNSCLVPTLYKGRRFLESLKISNADERDFSRLGGLMTFSSADFNRAAKDACIVLDALIEQKEIFLSAQAGD